MGTNVLLCHLPRLLSDIVRATFQDADDVELVGEVPELAMLAEAAAAANASVVICGGPCAVDALEAVLFAWPALRVIEVEQEGRSASVLELVPSRSPLGELSPELLLRAVRCA